MQYVYTKQVDIGVLWISISDLLIKMNKNNFIKSFEHPMKYSKNLLPVHDTDPQSVTKEDADI